MPSNRDIGRFFARGAIFALLNLPVAIAIWAIPNITNGDATWESPSVFSTMPRNEHFDYVFMGTSHARYFSVTKPNHEAVERLLGGSLLNIAQNAAGPHIQTVYLSYFLSRGNATDTIVYLVDPWAVAHKTWNRTFTFQREPFRLRPVVEMVRHGLPVRGIIADYAVFNLQGRSFSREGNPFPPLDRVEPSGKPVPDFYIESRADFLNGPWRDLDIDHLQKGYEQYLLAIAETARARGITMVFAFPSTLIPPQKVQLQLGAFLREHENAYGYHFMDFSEAVTDHQYFNDPDHLNTNGIEHFVGDFLAPALADLPGG